MIRYKVESEFVFETQSGSEIVFAFLKIKVAKSRS